MRHRVSILLVIRLLWELLRYDVVMALFGFRRIHRELSGLATARSAGYQNLASVCDALGWATSLYWKRVHCLQRSAVMVRLLRQNGISAELVIGYRSRPFFSHAWVEVQGRVVGDSPAYKDRLHVLERA